MQTTVYLHVGISERGCDRISLHVPQGTFLHLSTVNPVSTPSPGMHIGLRILMPLTLGSSSITPVLTPEWDVLVATTGMIKLSHGELSNKNCPELLTHETILKCQFIVMPGLLLCRRHSCPSSSCEFRGLSLSSSPCFSGVCGASSDLCVCYVISQR